MKDMVEKLHKLDQNKDKFLATLSHELRNPMASITMSLSLLDNVAPGGDQAKQALEIMKRQASQLSRLVDDLLEVTRINQNKIVLKKERIKLNELVNRVVEGFRYQFSNNEVSLDVDITSSSIFLDADPARLTQTLDNLIQNAAKFTKNGEKVLITMVKDEKKSEVIISIRDTGIGIQPELLSDLFQPFVQADRSLDRSRGGLGLGLSVVKGLVELHDGSVAVSSEGLGKGSEFTIRLPLPHEESNTEDQNLLTEGASTRSLRILMIEDNADLAEIMCELLSILGYEAIAALSGPEGIAKAKELHPDVILCDIGLPGMNGFEVARSISSDNELKDIILIAVSGYAQPDDLERSKAAGFIKHLAKPVSFDTLKLVLAEVQQ
ncbi:MAG: ATP-binding response regulator [Mobilitalea sp.]